MPATDLFVAHEQAIIAACAQHEEAHRLLPTYRRSIPFFIDTTKYLVKFGNPRYLSSEVTMQRKFASVSQEDSQRDPSTPRVPVVHHTFQHDDMMYAIIEFIETVQVSADTFTDKVAAAVLWLRRQPVPPGVVLGPLGSSPAWHTIFKDMYAPVPFTSTAALERFLNKGVSILQRLRPELAKISIASEPLVLTQSDMDPSNFGVDATGRPVILNFGEIGWLPESLANFTLLRTSTLADDVSARVFGDQLESVAASSNLTPIVAVKTLLVMSFRPDLGVDKDGYPVRRR